MENENKYTYGGISSFAFTPQPFSSALKTSIGPYSQF